MEVVKTVLWTTKIGKLVSAKPDKSSVKPHAFMHFPRPCIRLKNFKYYFGILSILTR